jgi:hypothetical protein
LAALGNATSIEHKVDDMAGRDTVALMGSFADNFLPMQMIIYFYKLSVEIIRFRKETKRATPRQVETCVIEAYLNLDSLLLV